MIVEFYGHSYLSAAGGGASARRYNIASRVADALGAYEANYAAGGAVASASNETNAFAITGVGYPTLTRNTLARALRARSAAPFDADSTLAIVHLGINDVALGLAATLDRGLAAHVAWLRCGGFFGAQPGGQSHASVHTPGGGWSDVAATNRNPGSGYRLLATAGQGFTLGPEAPLDGAFPGGEVVIFIIVPPAGGGVLEVRVAGATTRTLTRRITYAADAADPARGDGVTHVMAALRIRDLNPGATTITGTLRDPSGTGFGLLEYGIVGENPPPVLLVKPIYPPPSYQLFFPAAQPRMVDGLRDAVDRVAREFGARTASAPVDLLLRTAPSYLFDLIHPNDAGCRVEADAIIDAAPTLRRGPAASTVIPAAYAASWADAAAGADAAQIALLPGRQVSLQGRAKRTGTPTPGEAIITLPQAARPLGRIQVLVPGSTGTPTVEITPAGAVAYAAGTLPSGGDLDLSGITFTAA